MQQNFKELKIENENITVFYLLLIGKVPCHPSGFKQLRDIL
jgi:hypothetical protein